VCSSDLLAQDNDNVAKFISAELKSGYVPLIILWCIVGIVGTTLTILFINQLREKNQITGGVIYSEIHTN